MDKCETTFSTTSPECPYCGYQHQHDGGLFYDESLTEFTCESCDKAFDVRVYTCTSWTCTPKDRP